ATLDYREPRGERVLREALADHLGRTRGVIAEPEQIVVVQGTAQGVDLLLRILQARGVARVAVEDPSHTTQHARIRTFGFDGLAPEQVVQLGTVSKTLAPALRLGWLVAPPALADEAARAKRLLDDFSPALDQLTLAELLARGDYDRHVRRARAAYRRRRDRLL